MFMPHHFIRNEAYEFWSMKETNRQRQNFNCLHIFMCWKSHCCWPMTTKVRYLRVSWKCAVRFAFPQSATAWAGKLLYWRSPGNVVAFSTYQFRTMNWCELVQSPLYVRIQRATKPWSPSASIPVLEGLGSCIVDTRLAKSKRLPKRHRESVNRRQ